MNELPPSILSTFNESLVINMVVANLAQDENLKAIYTIICCKMSDQPNSITFQNIEEQVTPVLRDLKPSAVPASSGKFQNSDAEASVNDSRSPIKKRPQPQLISSTVWAKMSEEAKDQFSPRKERKSGATAWTQTAWSWRSR
jgi:hypothetical protein